MTLVVCDVCESVAVEVPVDIGYVSAICGQCARGEGG